ncbi:hypothetical protein SFR_1575 [Streptomyces sp. FR-008]|nr:hypothetical protein SFR_1575 [Streptomyces sp. FR-008]
MAEGGTGDAADEAGKCVTLRVHEYTVAPRG